MDPPHNKHTLFRINIISILLYFLKYCLKKGIFKEKAKPFWLKRPPARSLVIGAHGTRHTHALRRGGGGGDGRGPRTWLQLGGEVALAKPPPSSEAAPVAAPCTRADAPPSPAGPPRRSFSSSRTRSPSCSSSSGADLRKPAGCRGCNMHQIALLDLIVGYLKLL